MTGTLYIVGTPLGNLDDFSPRARKILSEVDAVLCEDTRKTGKLFELTGIQATTLSFHEHNEAERLTGILHRLEQGQSLALVSDAGMPLISDPGFGLVREVCQRGIPVTTVPGPTAPIVALALSGFPPAPFAFFGFPPVKPGRRSAFARQVLDWIHTAIVFVSPHRGPAELQCYANLAPDRDAALGRELTKKFEEVHRGTLRELYEFVDQTPPKGEWTLVIGPAPAELIEPEDLLETVRLIAARDSRPLKEVAFEVAENNDLPRRSLYKKLLEDKTD